MLVRHNMNLPFSFFFFLMIRRPPRSTLFPSPTLFRSREPREPGRERQRPGDSGEPAGPLVRAVRHGTDGGHRAGARTRDRKSTRLNSSHLVISYAVFCLKNKNKIDDSI